MTCNDEPPFLDVISLTLRPILKRKKAKCECIVQIVRITVSNFLFGLKKNIKKIFIGSLIQI